MKKMLAFLLAGTMMVGSLGVTSFADEVTDADPVVDEAIEEILEEIGDLDVSDLDDEAVEDVVEDLMDDIDDEEAEEEEIARNYFHNRFSDEFRKLYNERQETKRVKSSINEKRVKVAALKERARIKGEYWKLERAEFVEKEIKILKKSS